MRHLQGLMPYALASAAVVVASAIALGATIRGPGAGPAAPLASGEPTPAGSRATLSETGRMAYWRTAPNGQLELWVSDLDGGRRWTVANASSGSDIALTRWSPDGNAVAHVLSGQTVVVSRLDASSAFLDIPGELRTQRWRIVSLEWSPDATRIAATLRAASGLSNVSDVYLINARAASVWERITFLGDAFAGKWISPSELFIEEASGATIVLDLAKKTMRPLTGMPVTSPLIGRDGRVRFVGGYFVTNDVAAQPAGNGWVWSATIDGEDLRREVKDDRENLRLYGTLADGRSVVGVPGGAYVVGDAYVPLAFQAGTVRRVVLSPDGKRVVGITDQRILLIDPNKVPRILSGGLPPADAATVLISSVRDADVWFPSTPVTPVRSPAASREAPPAKLAFVLGRALWQSGPGSEIRALLTEQSGGSIGSPRWSPTGERIAVPVFPPSPAQVSAVWVAGPAGIRRFDVAARFPQGLSWSADGRTLGVWTTVAPRFDEWSTQLYDADTGRPTEKLVGRATLVGTGTFVLSDGEVDPTQGNRVAQRLELVGGEGRRVITDARRLAAAPLLRDLPDPALPSVISQFLPANDGEHVAVWLYRARNSGLSTGAIVVLRTVDGEPVWRMLVSPQMAPSDQAWSPSGHLLAGTTVRDGSGGVPAGRRTTVTDPLTGKTVLTAEGRFAGWAPDGEWVYVVRDEGLMAVRIDGTGSVRVNPIGVPVSATKP